jgi:hypothetical protein
MDRTELERLDREGLVLRAQAAGIRRARVLTRPELIDELLRLDPAIDETQLKRTRGFFGRARDLLSRVVERGLHLPDAADRFRGTLGDPLPQVPRPEPQAVPTVTLAEIYAAQGHKKRAVDTLKRVLEAEPEHGTARALIEKLEAVDYVSPPQPLPPEGEEPERLEDPEEAPGGDEEAGEESIAASEVAPVEGAVSVVEPKGAAVPVEVAPDTPWADEPATLPRESRRTLKERARLQPECVAIPIAEGASYVWWTLPHAARQSLPPGAFVVRAVVFEPTWDGPVQRTRDVRSDVDAAELVIGDLPAGAIVRVAIGVVDGDTFTPTAHSPALETSASRDLVRWTLEGARPIVPDDPSAASIARAAEGAARRSALGPR